MKIINSSKLNLSDVPSPNAKLKQIRDFALTYNPIDEVTKGKKMPTLNDEDNNFLQILHTLSLSELRYILYFEQRRWNHLGRLPDSRSEQKIRIVICEIRKILRENSF